MRVLLAAFTVGHAASLVGLENHICLNGKCDEPISTVPASHPGGRECTLSQGSDERLPPVLHCLPVLPSPTPPLPPSLPPSAPPSPPPFVETVGFIEGSCFYGGGFNYDSSVDPGRGTGACCLGGTAQAPYDFIQVFSGATCTPTMYRTYVGASTTVYYMCTGTLTLQRHNGNPGDHGGNPGVQCAPGRCVNAAGPFGPTCALGSNAQAWLACTETCRFSCTDCA